MPRLAILYMFISAAPPVLHLEFCSNPCHAMLIYCFQVYTAPLTSMCTPNHNTVFHAFFKSRFASLQINWAICSLPHMFCSPWPPKFPNSNPSARNIVMIVIPPLNRLDVLLHCLISWSANFSKLRIDFWPLLALFLSNLGCSCSPFMVEHNRKWVFPCLQNCTPCVEGFFVILPEWIVTFPTLKYVDYGYFVCF